MNGKQFLIEGELFTALLSYLNERPYREVAMLISQLMTCKEATIVDANSGTST